MIRITIVIVLILLKSSCCIAQHEDFIWMFGSAIYDQVQEFVHEDTTWGATNIDFNFAPPKIYYDHNRLIDFRATNVSISTEDGQILMYTNGQAIWDGENKFIEDTINYNDQWENWTLVQDEILVLAGLPTIQGALILPSPSIPSQYYAIYDYYDLGISTNTKLSYSLVDLTKPEGEQLVVRDNVVVEDTLTNGCLNAVRHANGRDWWVTKIRQIGGGVYKWLITPDGIETYELQHINNDFEGFIGQSYFSPDGTKIAFQLLDKILPSGVQILIGDFDRTTGDISNIQFEIIDGNSFAQGLSFSPNSKYLYITDALNLYQYDLDEDNIIDSRIAIEAYDGFNYYYTIDSLFPEPQRFGWMGLAPDGKIYVSTQMGTSRVMHRINNPNLKGIACDMEQHSVFLPTSYARGIPNFPNYRLGPLDNSPADTLGLNNHPIAKYRYVQDTLEDLRLHFFDLSYYDPQDYEWDFGDGNSSDELEPNHTYAEKGVYEVCLTVSNIYDTSTSCKPIMLGTTSTIDRELAVDISIYPNPTSDYLTINFHNYIALDGVVRIYDVSGKEVMSVELERASNVLNLAHLVSGVYIYKIYDGEDEIYEGKVVVVR